MERKEGLVHPFVSAGLEPDGAHLDALRTDMTTAPFVRAGVRVDLTAVWFTGVELRHGGGGAARSPDHGVEWDSTDSHTATQTGQRSTIP